MIGDHCKALDHRLQRAWDAFYERRSFVPSSDESQDTITIDGERDSPLRMLWCACSRTRRAKTSRVPTHSASNDRGHAEDSTITFGHGFEKGLRVSPPLEMNRTTSNMNRTILAHDAYLKTTDQMMSNHDTVNHNTPFWEHPPFVLRNTKRSDKNCSVKHAVCSSQRWDHHLRGAGGRMVGTLVMCDCRLF